MAYRAAILCLGTLLVALTACNDPASRAAVARREEKLQRTGKVLQGIEAGRTDKLERTVDLLARRHARDVSETRQLSARLDKEMDRERTRWEQNRPLHEQRFHEHLQGDVQNIEKTLPYILY